MNDAEVIKALECIASKENVLCDSCPNKKLHLLECHRQGAKNALDLINRQKAEIERLEKRLEAVQGAKCVYSYDGETIEYCVHSPCPISKTADQIKAEAIKEFAERLKSSEYKEEYAEHLCYMVDNLVKEMAGEVK